MLTLEDGFDETIQKQIVPFVGENRKWGSLGPHIGDMRNMRSHEYEGFEDFKVFYKNQSNEESTEI